jgi:hypothetical protein
MSTKTTISKTAPGAERVLSTQHAPGSKQMGFSVVENQQLIADQEFLNDLFQEALKAAGTTEWLTRALNRKPSYETKINDGIAGRDDRSVQLPWLAPLLRDADSAYALIAGLCDRCGFMPPVLAKVAERAELGEAALEVIAEMKDEEQREVFKKRVAKKCGIRAEDVKL